MTDGRARQIHERELEERRRVESAGKIAVHQFLASRGFGEDAIDADKVCHSFEHYGFTFTRQWSDKMSLPVGLFGKITVMLRVAAVRSSSSKPLDYYRNHEAEGEEVYVFAGFSDAREFTGSLPGFKKAIESLIAPNCYVGWACASGEFAVIICLSKGPVVPESYSQWYGTSVPQVTSFKDTLGLPDWFEARREKDHMGNSSPAAINAALLSRSIRTVESEWWQRLVYTGFNVLRIRSEQQQSANRNPEDIFKLMSTFADNLTSETGKKIKAIQSLRSMKAVAELYSALSENCIMGREFALEIMLTGKGLREMFTDPADVATVRDTETTDFTHEAAKRNALRPARQVGSEIIVSTPIPRDLVVLVLIAVAISLAATWASRSSFSDAAQTLTAVGAAGIGLVLGLYKTGRYGNWPYRDLLRLRYRATSLSDLSEGLLSRRAALEAMIAVRPAERRYLGPYDCLVGRIAGAHADDLEHTDTTSREDGETSMSDYFRVDIPTSLYPFAMHEEIVVRRDKLGHLIVHIGGKRMSIQMKKDYCAHLSDEVATSTSLDTMRYVVDVEVGRASNTAMLDDGTCRRR